MVLCIWLAGVRERGGSGLSVGRAVTKHGQDVRATIHDAGDEITVGVSSVVSTRWTGPVILVSRSGL